MVVCGQLKSENSSLPVTVHISKTHLLKFPIDDVQAPVVQRLDNAIHWTNHLLNNQGQAFCTMWPLYIYATLVTIVSHFVCGFRF